MMSLPTFCPETGKPMKRDTRPLTLTFKSQSITFDQPGWYREDSDDGVLDPEDQKVSDRNLNRLKARVQGLLEPEEIQRVRKKLGLTQNLAGELIGGGPRAFQKYESGDLLPSQGINSLLVVLDEMPEALNILRSKKQAATRELATASS